MKRRFLGWFLSAATVAVLGCSTGHAAQMLLSDLVNGGSIQSGDKIFRISRTPRTAICPPLRTSRSRRSTRTDSTEFGSLADSSTCRAGINRCTGDLQRQRLSGHDQVISGVTLSANPAVFNGPGLASVTETFVPDIDNKKLVIYDFGDGDFDLVDSVTLDAGYRTLPVQKDLILRATGNAGAVTMSFLTKSSSKCLNRRVWLWRQQAC